MTDNAKIRPTHLRRGAFVYVRQSSASQLERNPESTDRQYKLVDRAVALGWKPEQVTVIDEEVPEGQPGRERQEQREMELFGKVLTPAERDQFLGLLERLLGRLPPCVLPGCRRTGYCRLLRRR